MNLEQQHLNEIIGFLNEHQIDYSTRLNNFCLYDGHPDGKRSYEIEYVNSIKYPIDYPKFNIKGVDKNYFYTLSKYAEENNSFKLWIKDFEWANVRQREVLKSYILHAAGKTPYKWYARECEIKEVKSKEARAFEIENCFYGKRGASLNLGLYSTVEKNDIPANTLLMLYTFGKNFFAKNESIIEVIRVGTRKFSHVSGGSSRLFKYFLNNYKTIHIGDIDVPVEKVKFYSDYDHNIGSSMKNLGFIFDGYSGGGFMNYWIEEGIAKQREPMRHKWIMEQMSLGKCLAIPNAGVKKYILDLTCKSD